MRLLHRLVPLAGAMLAAFASGAAAQAYPVKPVRIIVPFAPGGPNDILARVIGQKLTETWGQQVIAENRPGGGTVIGTDAVVKSPPDGHTLLMVSPSHTTNPSLRKLPFDTLRDLALVIFVAHSPNVLLAHPSLPARTVKDLLALARSRPDQITFSSGGNGTSTHLGGELLSQMGRVKMVHVPYKGGAPALTAVISGEVTWLFGNAIPSVPHIKSGRLRALAVTGAQRNPALPDVPTVADTLRGFEIYSWYGVAAPGGTPRDVVARLNQDINRILSTEDMRSRLAAEGAEPRGGTPEEFAAYFRAEIEKWAKVIKAAGIRLE